MPLRLGKVQVSGIPRRYPLSAISIALTRRGRLYRDYLLFAISLRVTFERIFLPPPLPPPGQYYILYPRRARATRKENGTALFSTGKSHVRAERILRLPAKKGGRTGRRMGRGLRAERLAFYPGPSLSPSELSRPGRATPVSRLSLDREKMSRPRQLGKIGISSAVHAAPSLPRPLDE